MQGLHHQPGIGAARAQAAAAAIAGSDHSDWPAYWRKINSILRDRK
jgi:hypothetical protein